MLLARHGRPFTNEEEQLSFFYLYFDHLKTIKKPREKGVIYGETPEESAKWEKAIETTVKTLEEQICKTFLDAIKSHDGDKIIRLAKAARFWKGKLDDDYFHEEADRDLYQMLLLKRRCQIFDRKMTVREVAEHLAAMANRKFVPASDGFKSLRRKLIAIEFPLGKANKK